jgi:hypothetical protein
MRLLDSDRILRCHSETLVRNLGRHSLEHCVMTRQRLDYADHVHQWHNQTKLKDARTWKLPADGWLSGETQNTRFKTILSFSVRNGH